jgi:hypothetical protein
LFPEEFTRVSFAKGGETIGVAAAINGKHGKKSTNPPMNSLAMSVPLLSSFAWRDGHQSASLTAQPQRHRCVCRSMSAVATRADLLLSIIALAAIKD